MGFHGRKESWVTIICVTLSYLVFKTIEKVAYFGKNCMFLFIIFMSCCVACTEPAWASQNKTVADKPRRLTVAETGT